MTTRASNRGPEARRRRHSVGVAVAVATFATALAGCTGDTLAEPSIVTSWRVLGIVAAPPEVRPGEDVTVSAIVVAPDGTPVRAPSASGIRARFHVCLSSERTGALQGLTYEPEQLRAGCEGADPATSMELMTELDQVRATIPGTLTAPLFERIDELAPLLGEVLGDGGSGALVAQAVREVGLPITVQVTIENEATGATLVRAFKRVLISERSAPGSNPPPPTFAVAGTPVAGSEGSFECTPLDPGAPPRVRRDTAAVLAPSADDETWRETYPIIDVRGQVVAARERPFYSWFSTAGSFDEETTVAPAREGIWRTPKVPGTYPLWVVVRDGHGGTSGCRTEVIIE